MDWRAMCMAVIPCLDEAATIAEVVRGVQLHLSAVLVVDDGSKDRTAEVAQTAGAQVLKQDSTHGKGASLRAGWQYARQHGFTWAFSLDGDGQHSPQDIPKFTECAQRTGAALVVGNRMHDSAGMPLVRRFVNRWMSRQLSSMAATPLPDSQCGFRLMDLGAWSSLDVQSSHFEIESEILLAFLRAGMRVDFVPIQTIYKKGPSKIHPLMDTIRWLRWKWGERPVSSRQKSAD